MEGRVQRPHASWANSWVTAQMRRIKMFYFDINGALAFHYVCKPAMANAAFEQAVRRTGFDRPAAIDDIRIHD